ncbi:MAG: hypothetical protein ACK4NT_03330 [Candidatus Omnitrophota bacterium]
MKRLKLGLILSVLLGLGITYSALAGFNPFLNDPPAQIEPSSPSGSSMLEMNNLYNLLSNPSPSTPVFINEPELPDNIEEWMEFLSNPDNYEFISQFIEWLEKNPSNIDAFVKYILKNYERMGGLFNQIQREIGIYGFVGKNYNLYLVRNNNAFIELAITDKDNNLLLGAVFNSQRQMVSSIKQEEENDKKVYSVTTQDKTYKSYKLALGKEIRYVPGDGYSSDFSFSQGTMEIKIDGNFRLVVGDGSLLLNVNGRKIVLPPGSQIKETAAGWNVTLTDSTIIFIDKDGSTMEVTLPNGVGSFALDISELVKIEIEQKENMLTINGYEIAAVCYDEEGDCQRKVLSLSISQAGGVVVKQGEAIVTVNGAKITLSKEMSLRFEGTDAIVTKNDKISYKINKDGWVSQITIAGINIPLPPGVKPSDIKIDAEKNSVTVSIEGKTYTFKIETVAGSTSLPIDRVNIVLPTDQTLVLPPGASLANEENKLIVVNAMGKKIAEISLNEDGSFSINGIQFVINDVSGFQVFLGIDDNGGVWIKAGKNGVEETISLPRETKVVNIFKQGDKLIISYTDDKNNTSSIVIQGNPSGSTTPQPGGGPPATYDDWLKWLEKNPEQLAEFLNWLKEHPDKIGDFLDWIKQRRSDDKLWNAFLNLLTAGNAEAQRAVEILLKHDAGIKFLAELLEGLNSPLRSDERKRRNLAWALSDLINYLSTKAEIGDAEIKRAVAALFLAMARYGNEKALGALKSLARKGDISAIQAIQYLITDNGRSDLIDFLIELASQSQELRNKVLEALGLLVKDKNVDMRIKEGAIRTLIEIAKRGADEATQIAAINTLWALGIWLADSKNENRGERWIDLLNMIIKGLDEIAKLKGQFENVKALAETALNDLEYRKNNQGNPTPTPTSNPSNNNSSNNNNRTNPSGTGPTAGFNLGTGTEGRAPKGNNAEGKNQSPRGENPNNSLSASLRENIFNNPSLSTPLQRLKKAKEASSKLIERFKKVDKRSGQKGRILKKKLEKKLREKGLSEEEIKEKLKEFSQKLSENDEEAKKYLAGLGFSQEEIAKDFQDAEGFFSAEDQEKYLRENLGIEGKEAEEILRMTDELAQIEFLTDAGFSESTAKLIVNPALVKDKLEAFFNLVEKIEQKLNLEDNPEARKEIADLLTEALFNGDITLENAQELLDDPEKPGEKVTRLELLLRDLLKRIESRSQSVFSPFLP